MGTPVGTAGPSAVSAGAVPSFPARCRPAPSPGGLGSAHSPVAAALTLALSSPGLQERDTSSQYFKSLISLKHPFLPKKTWTGFLGSICLTSPRVTNTLKVLLFDFCQCLARFKKYFSRCFLLCSSQSSHYCQTGAGGSEKACA